MTLAFTDAHLQLSDWQELVDKTRRDGTFDNDTYTARTTAVMRAWEKFADAGRAHLDRRAAVEPGQATEE